MALGSVHSNDNDLLGAQFAFHTIVRKIFLVIGILAVQTRVTILLDVSYSRATFFYFCIARAAEIISARLPAIELTQIKSLAVYYEHVIASINIFLPNIEDSERWYSSTHLPSRSLTHLDSNNFLHEIGRAHV